MSRRTVCSSLLGAVLALGLLAGATGCSDNVEQQQSVTISFGHPFPPTHPVHVQVFEPWANEVLLATGGTVTIEFYPSQTLSARSEVYQSTVDGGQGIGWALQGYSVGRFPAAEVVGLPFVFDSAVEATEVLWTLHDEFEAIRNEYADVKLLGLWTHDVADLWLAGDQASDVPDLSGLTVRAPTQIQVEVIETLGGAPVNLSVQEIRDALGQGAIDGVMIANSGLSSYDLYGVLGSGVQCNCYVSASFLAMNQDLWDSLSVSQQRAIERLSGREVSLAAARAYDAASNAVAERYPQEGINKIVLDDTQLAAWRDATQSVVDRWVGRHAGDFPARAMYDRMLELAAD
ncbi:TRAP transporter substrate-binding protein [Candidatus Poriferisocius sp.]|uniref:TRAP transporter substrate-binding protein n=1 Tax=Candidatus Poriferisocius sp. TaxID=3101276 RepID=UPI003B5BA22B